MDMIADALLIAGAAGAALYCRVLSRRLTALKDLDSGVGAAIAALSRQVDDMKLSLDAAKSVSGDQSKSLSQLTARAEMAAGRLELLLAALHENGRKRPLNVRGGPASASEAFHAALRAAAEKPAPELAEAPPAAVETAPEPEPEFTPAPPPAAAAAAAPATHWGAAP